MKLLLAIFMLSFAPQSWAERGELDISVKCEVEGVSITLESYMTNSGYYYHLTDGRISKSGKDDVYPIWNESGTDPKTDLEIETGFKIFTLSDQYRQNAYRFSGLDQCSFDGMNDKVYLTKQSSSSGLIRTFEPVKCTCTPQEN